MVMNIGERIRERRKELGLSVDDVASKLDKNRATIYRYESNDIENLPITVLEPLARVLNTTPTYLLGLETAKPTTLTQDEATLLESYNKLNSTGKDEAIKRVTELTYVKGYTATEDNVMSLEEAKKYLRSFKGMAAFSGDNINTLSDEQIINRAVALKHEFEEVPHKYKK